MAENDDYSELIPKLPPWPTVSRMSDGRWLRHWNVVLKDIPERVSVDELEERLSSDGNQVRIRVDGRCLCVDIITREWGWDDPLYFYNHAVLEFLDRVMGEIDTINGEPKSNWSAWWPRPGRSPFFG